MSELVPMDVVEKVVIQGDLSKLTPEQKVSYYKGICASTGLNPALKPFEYLKLNGKEVLYATRACTDQLRALNKISIKITDKRMEGGAYLVTAQATTPEGRVDESTGATSVEGLKGDHYVNALLKAETKAKRRVTLSICGLGLLDESELETVETTRPSHPQRTTQAKPIVNAAPPQTVVQVATVDQTKEDLAYEEYNLSLAKQAEEMNSLPPQGSSHYQQAKAPVLQESQKGDLTTKQVSRLWAISKSNGWDYTSTLNIMNSRFGFKDPSRLSRAQYDELCTALAGPKESPAINVQAETTEDDIPF